MFVIRERLYVHPVLLYIVAMQIQAIVVSWNQRLFVFVAKGRAKPFGLSCTTTFVSRSLLRFLPAKNFLSLRNK